MKSLRPYIVIPKLIEQPTWGGTYIVEAKNWQEKNFLRDKKIGQSYELYDKSNLSLAISTSDPTFTAELTDPKLVSAQTNVSNAIILASLITENPSEVLGKKIVDVYGPSMHLLLKFTQALGNSFQLHVADGVTHPRWKPKPESWYYFEPGLITCGVKEGVDWNTYQTAVTMLDAEIRAVAAQVAAKTLSYDRAQEQIASLIKKADPWQHVNVIRVEKGTLLDLSPCGIHHSWEEDLKTIPLGNVLYEIQLNVMDDVATIRSFDKGKISKDGNLRPLQIEDYFTLADRSPGANNPATHMRAPKMIEQTNAYTHERLLDTKYYAMDRVSLKAKGVEFAQSIETFRHVFVRSGEIAVTAGGLRIGVAGGHSVFVPAGCTEYAVRANAENTEILISY